MPVLVWFADGQLCLARIDRAGSTRIGRSQQPPDIMMTSGDLTVSRRHAEIRYHSGQCIIENLSEKNPLKVKGKQVLAPAGLADGDVLEFGTVRASYHDLERARRDTGRTCNHCRRENQPGQADCWYCGQNLVSAGTLDGRDPGPACRLVAPDGSAETLFKGEHLALFPGGQWLCGNGTHAPEGAVAEVVVPEKAAILRAMPGVAAVNGELLGGEHALADGDVLAVAGGLFMAVVG